MSRQYEDQCIQSEKYKAAAIHAIQEGKSFFSPGVRRILKEDYMHQLAKLGVKDTYELLTPREREVLPLVAEGKATKRSRICSI